MNLPERTSMVLPCPHILHYYPQAIVRLPVLFLPLLSIVVSDPIGIILLKCVHIHISSLGKLSSEELQGIIKGESNTFQEQLVLQPGLVLDMVAGGEDLKT